MIDINDILSQFGEFGFNMQQDDTKYQFQLYLGDALVNQGEVTGWMGARQNMQQMIIQIAQERQPMKITCNRNYYKWNGDILHEEQLTFSNKIWDNAHK